MELGDVGERALVKLIRGICKRGSKIRAGIGDDAAAISINDRCVVVTTDVLVARTSFPLGATPKQMGRKAVVVNLSDLAAMGAKPLGLLFSIGLPRDLEIGFFKQLISAMDSTVQEYGAYIVGGDLDESGETVIAGTAFGIARKHEILKRSGAKPDDVIAVTGRLGAASAGLKILLDRSATKSFPALVKAQLEPVARVREGMLLARSGFVTSAIDITDGLAASLWQLANESGKRFVIDRTKIPEHPLVRKFAAEHGFNVDDFVLFGGEDFELLFTVRAEGWKRIRQILRRVGTNVTLIGRVVKGRKVFIEEEGEIRILPNRGYEHFRP